MLTSKHLVLTISLEPAAQKAVEIVHLCFAVELCKWQAAACIES